MNEGDDFSCLLLVGDILLTICFPQFLFLHGYHHKNQYQIDAKHPKEGAGLDQTGKTEGNTQCRCIHGCLISLYGPSVKKHKFVARIREVARRILMLRLFCDPEITVSA